MLSSSNMWYVPSPQSPANLPAVTPIGHPCSISLPQGVFCFLREANVECIKDTDLYNFRHRPHQHVRRSGKWYKATRYNNSNYTHHFDCKQIWHIVGRSIRPIASDSRLLGPLPRWISVQLFACISIEASRVGMGMKFAQRHFGRRLGPVLPCEHGIHTPHTHLYST